MTTSGPEFTQRDELDASLPAQTPEQMVAGIFRNVFDRLRLDPPLPTSVFFTLTESTDENCKDQLSPIHIPAHALFVARLAIFSRINTRKTTIYDPDKISSGSRIIPFPGATVTQTIQRYDITKMAKNDLKSIPSSRQEIKQRLQNHSIPRNGTPHDVTYEFKPLKKSK